MMTAMEYGWTGHSGRPNEPHKLSGRAKQFLNGTTNKTETKKSGEKTANA